MKYLILLPVQALVSLVLGFGAAILRLRSPVLSGICLWAVLPAVGALGAYFVTVKGINNYIAWLLPPVGAIAGHFLAFFYPPKEPFAYLFIAIISIIGAATGDVVKKNAKNRNQ